MSGTVPIPPATWSRLRALDATHDFSFHRCDSGTGPGIDPRQGHSSLNYPRWWVVRVWPRDNPEWTATTTGADLAKTLATAIDAAERTHKSRQEGPPS